ncbi:hypothetical protein [Kitasatospora sp. NPDC092286]|uniref:hypothetical protein n=1 Tax=Kitasatospora sp. NPDC092286 TaxID=3364087 RepID=UPI003823B95C
MITTEQDPRLPANPARWSARVDSDHAARTISFKIGGPEFKGYKAKYSPTLLTLRYTARDGGPLVLDTVALTGRLIKANGEIGVKGHTAYFSDLEFEGAPEWLLPLLHAFTTVPTRPVADVLAELFADLVVEA